MILKEAYNSFKADYPTEKVGLSRFCNFKPEHVKLRDKTPENVCLCELHENMRLLITAVCWLPNSTTASQ